MFASMPSHVHRPAPPTVATERLLFLPGRERIGKGALARRAFLQRKDRAPPIGVDDRDIEPRTLLEQLDVALLVGLDGGKPNQKEAVGHLDRQAGERRAARLLR